MTGPLPRFENVLNFRDFGGQEGAFGRVRSGLLYRSAALDRRTDSDMAALCDLGIDVVVDLRRWSERQQAPSRWPPEFRGTIVETVEQDVAEAPHDRYLGGAELSSTLLRERVLDFYRTAFADPRHRSLFAQALERIASASGPVLVHCAAGKDRTGLFAAVTLELLGVAREDIMADYLLTASNRPLVDYLNERAMRFAEALGRPLARGDAEILTSVDRAYLETAWHSLEEAHGSVEAYVADIGVGSAILERLRRRFVG